MKKVCHMTSVHKSRDTRIFYKQCTSLAKAGYDVYLVAQGESFEKNGVKIVGVPEIKGGRFKRMTQGAKSVYKKALEIDADIYQIHDPELLPYALKLKKKGKKVIFDSHEDCVQVILEKQYLSKTMKLIVKLFFKVYHDYIIKRLNVVITVTPFIYDRLKQINEVAYMITNYPIISDINEDKKYTISRNIIFAGGINEFWNHHLIIKALEKSENVTYIICGRSEEQYLNKLKKLPRWRDVKFLGFISRKEVFENMKNVSIGMAVAAYSPNVCNNMGTLGNTKIFEYMEEALPVICTDYVLWKEIVDKYNCGICVNPYDSDEIANAINYLLNNPEIAKEMGQNGRRAVLEEFNWNVEEKKLLDLYKSLAKIR